MHATAAIQSVGRLPDDATQLTLPQLQRRPLLDPEFVLVVDGVGDAAGALDVVQDARPDVLRHANAGEVGATVHGCVKNAVVAITTPARAAYDLERFPSVGVAKYEGRGAFQRDNRAGHSARRCPGLRSGS